MNGDSGGVNGDSENFSQIVHDKSESLFTINQNWRSRWFRISVHDHSEYAAMAADNVCELPKGTLYSYCSIMGDFLEKAIAANQMSLDELLKQNRYKDKQ